MILSGLVARSLFVMNVIGKRIGTLLIIFTKPLIRMIQAVGDSTPRWKNDFVTREVRLGLETKGFAKNNK